ncbi:MAG: hypothetical protein HC804_07380 [Anaerolineae bacterium]|nr:hypothetical protein [Anaerolineae bacterium]
MNKQRLFILILALFLAAFAAVTYSARAQETVSSGIYRGVSTAVHFDISPPLRDMVAPDTPANAAGNVEIPERATGLEGAYGPQDTDPLVQSSIGPNFIPGPSVSFDGPSNIANVSPPDPVGDVGPNHYVAMSNLYYAVYDKTGTLLLGPFANNTLWAGFGGDCQTDNSGDPIVLYDQISDRWMLSQFTASGPTYFNCVAVSTTPDPTGSYYRWAFSTGTNFPDYPKYGFWSDALYISTREFANGTTFAGMGAYAVDRAQLIAGIPAPTVISFLVTAASAGGAYNIGDGLLPTDLDGMTPPPPDTPNYFVGSMDNGGPYGAPQDALTIWEFDADFVTPANSTFTLANTVPVAAFDSVFPCSPGSRDCIPQPGTAQKLDILSYRQRPLWRLAYRNFGTHESLVTNQSVEATTSVAGVRWYEIRDPAGTPTIYQQGTYAPADGINRWMGSIAMDRDGNMALGYSASNAATFPSVWYTGRLATDPLGTMPQGEASIIDGTGSQTGSARWGDYTSMNVDPVDDCTFWYVNEYVPTSSAVGWRLRIGAFKFDECSPSVNASVVLTKTVGTDATACATTDAITITIGTDVTYCYEIENTGDTTLNLHDLDDSELGSILAGFPYALSPGASAFITQTASLASTTVNTATWTAYNPAGYSYDDAAPYNFIDISGSGTPLGLADDGEANVTMPFQFTYYGVTSDLVRIGNNGGILFATTTGEIDFSNTALPNAAHPLAIFPYWDDIDSETGDVYYETMGSAPNRMFIVQWNDRPHFPGPGVSGVTFQVVLFETTNEILFQYADLDFGNPATNYGASATVGLNEDGSSAVQYSFNTAVLTDSMAISWMPSVAASASATDSAMVTVLIPEMAVDPTEFVVSQPMTTVVTHTLTISNIGDGDLDWTIDEELPTIHVPHSGDPQRQNVPGPRTAPVVDVESFLGAIVVDGGFEAGSPSPFWTEASTNFGSPLCTIGLCGAGGGTGPHSGDWWSWFGGIAAYEEGSVAQDVTIPSGSATLSFWLEVPVACANATDYMEVLLDGTQVYLVDGTSALCGVVGYSLQSVDVSAFADGGVHNLEFHSEIFGGAVTNFFVDDVSIDVSGPPPACSTLTDIPWVTVNPTSGTTAGGDSSDVIVSFDSAGLSTGVYTGTLCINSNDPVTPLVTVPLTLTVVAQSFGVEVSTQDADLSGAPGTTVMYTVWVTNTG